MPHELTQRDELILAVMECLEFMPRDELEHGVEVYRISTDPTVDLPGVLVETGRIAKKHMDAVLAVADAKVEAEERAGGRRISSADKLDEIAREKDSARERAASAGAFSARTKKDVKSAWAAYRKKAGAAVSEEELRRLASTESPQGVLAVALKVSASLEDWEPAGEAAILVFDRLSDPGNLGTLLRAAHGLGADWAVTLPGSVDPWNPKAVRASAGSLFSLPVSQEPWSLVVAWLRRHDFTILCADPGGQTVPRAGVSPAPARFALVVGSEPTGLSDEVRAECQRLVAIDLVGGAESLNAAIAGALLLDRLLSG